MLCENSYSSYTNFFESIDSSFTPDGFEKVESLSSTYSSSAFPKNSYFIETDDLYQNDAFKPQNRKMVFFDTEHKSVFMVSFLYSEEHLATRFLTIDEFPIDNMSGELSDFEIYASEMFEFVLEEEHCIMLIKAFPLHGESDDQSVSDYRMKVISFIQYFADSLAERHSDI